jgi:hypothetical protein
MASAPEGASRTTENRRSSLWRNSRPLSSSSSIPSSLRMPERRCPSLRTASRDALGRLATNVSCRARFACTRRVRLSGTFPALSTIPHASAVRPVSGERRRPSPPRSASQRRTEACVSAVAQPGSSLRLSCSHPSSYPSSRFSRPRARRYRSSCLQRPTRLLGYPCPPRRRRRSRLPPAARAGRAPRSRRLLPRAAHDRAYYVRPPGGTTTLSRRIRNEPPGALLARTEDLILQPRG